MWSLYFPVEFSGIIRNDGDASLSLHDGTCLSLSNPHIIGTAIQDDQNLAQFLQIKAFPMLKYRDIFFLCELEASVDYFSVDLNLLLLAFQASQVLIKK